MDCTSVRLILNLAGREGKELVPADKQDLDEHLGACPGCARLAREERKVDRALGWAMNDVAVPASLKARILDHLPAPARPRYWPWIGAAACVLLALGGGGYWLFKPQPVVSLDNLVEELAHVTVGEDDTNHWLKTQGIAAKAPSRFNYFYLQSMSVQNVQGRKVARLIFFHPGDANRPAAMAQVYILPPGMLDLGDQMPRVRSKEQAVVLPSENGANYFVIYSTVGGSSLDAFLEG